MLGFLFRTLTAKPNRGAALFAAVTAEARKPHWYVEGRVPDTIDGRFAVLASITALTLVRIEAAGEQGHEASVGLTERFIEVMESEHRELGLGDPTLGKTVRKLVGSLARKTELWRSAASGVRGWADATRESLYRTDVPADALEHSSGRLGDLRSRLDRSGLTALVEGRIG